MDCCYFNSCILNDTDFLNKYKKKFTKLDGKLSKPIFVSVDITNELIVSLNIDSDIKLYFLR